MIKSANALLRQFSRIGGELYLLPPSRFLILGDETLILGNAPFKVSKPSLEQRSDAIADARSERHIRKIFANMHMLRTRAVATFNLTKPYLRRLTILADELNSTHVRFFNDDDGRIIARLFDVRISSDLLLPRNKRIHSSATLETNATTQIDFSATLSLESLNLLPRDDLLVSVYEDGILEAEPVNGKFSECYLCRDQGIIEPFTSFQHETMNRTVYFVHHPSD